MFINNIKIEGKNWGFDFAVFPKYRSEEAIKQILTLEEHSSKILAFTEEYKQDRPLGKIFIKYFYKIIIILIFIANFILKNKIDTQLMAYAYNLCQVRNLDPLHLVPATIFPTEDDTRYNFYN